MPWYDADTHTTHACRPVTPTGNVFETPIWGTRNIAYSFGKHSPKQFWLKHGPQLRAFGITFYSVTGNPSTRRIGAYQSELLEWKTWKAIRGEDI